MQGKTNAEQEIKEKATNKVTREDENSPQSPPVKYYHHICR